MRDRGCPFEQALLEGLVLALVEILSQRILTPHTEPGRHTDRADRGHIGDRYWQTDMGLGASVRPVSPNLAQTPQDVLMIESILVDLANDGPKRAVHQAFRSHRLIDLKARPTLLDMTALRFSIAIGVAFCSVFRTGDQFATWPITSWASASVAPSTSKSTLIRIVDRPGSLGHQVACAPNRCDVNIAFKVHCDAIDRPSTSNSICLQANGNAGFQRRQQRFCGVGGCAAFRDFAR